MVGDDRVKRSAAGLTLRDSDEVECLRKALTAK